MRAKWQLLFSTIFFAPFFSHVLCGSQPLWVLSFVLFFGLPLLLDKCASGLRCLVPTLAAQFVQSQQPLVVGSPAVTVCSAPALAVQGVGRSLLYPLAAPVC